MISDGSVGFDQIEREDIKRIVYQHLQFVLFTRPGEIISDHTFGVGIEDYIFLQSGEPKLLNLQSTITKQIGRYISYLTSFKVIVSFTHVDYNKMSVQIKYSIDHLEVEEVASFIIIEDN